MIIRLIPQRRDSDLAVSVSDDIIVVNGETFDFSGLPEGASLPHDAVGSHVFVGTVTRKDGVVGVDLALPYGVVPVIDPMEILTIDVIEGDLSIPGHDAVQPEIIVGGTINWGMTIPPVIPLTQRDLDEIRYKRRAEVQSDLMAWMAADNMARVRSGEWTVHQLTVLMRDPSVQAAREYMTTLSFEFAAEEIAAAETPMLTPEIKAAWVAKLQANFFLEP